MSTPSRCGNAPSAPATTSPGAWTAKRALAVEAGAEPEGDDRRAAGRVGALLQVLGPRHEHLRDDVAREVDAGVVAADPGRRRGVLRARSASPAVGSSVMWSSGAGVAQQLVPADEVAQARRSAAERQVPYTLLAEPNCGSVPSLLKTSWSPRLAQLRDEAVGRAVVRPRAPPCRCAPPIRRRGSAAAARRSPAMRRGSCGAWRP